MTIVENDEVRNGKPHIEGTQITVDDVYKFLNEQNLSTEEITSRWDITEEQLEEAIDYIDDHTEMVKQIIRDDQKAVEEVKKTWKERMRENERERQERIGNELHLISGYNPETYSKPVMMVSTVYSPSEKQGERKRNSTAILFGEALNYHHLMAKVFMTSRQRDVTEIDNEILPVSDFIEIESHDSWMEAWLFHRDVVTNLGPEKYDNLFEEYCPKFLKDHVDMETPRNKVKKLRSQDEEELQRKFNSLVDREGDTSVVDEAEEIVRAYREVVESDD